jgi:hypothetical protein
LFDSDYEVELRRDTVQIHPGVAYLQLETILKASSRLIAGVVATLLTGIAGAHHSFAMFDATKTMELDGTVKEFQFTNPHSWLKIVVMKDGVAQEWNIELASVGTLYRNGVRRDTLTPGDKIKININPLRNGEPGGAGVGLIELNGKSMPPGMLGSPQK